jgi:hypothetical protein
VLTLHLTHYTSGITDSSMGNGGRRLPSRR